MNHTQRLCGGGGAPLVGALLLPHPSPPPAHAGWHIAATTASPLRPSESDWRTPQIVDLDHQQLAVLHHPRQVYWQGPIQIYVATLANRSKGRWERLERLAKAHPRAERRPLGEWTGPHDSLGPRLTVSVAPTRQKASVGGYPARKYVVLRNGTAYEETWVTEEINLAADVNLSRLDAFVGQLRESRTTPAGTVPAELIGHDFPVKTVNLFTHMMVKEVVHAEQRNVSAAAFMVPKSYRPQALIEMLFPNRSSIGRRL